MSKVNLMSGIVPVTPESRSYTRVRDKTDATYAAITIVLTWSHSHDQLSMLLLFCVTFHYFMTYNKKLS